MLKKIFLLIAIIVMVCTGCAEEEAALESISDVENEIEFFIVAQKGNKNESILIDQGQPIIINRENELQELKTITVINQKMSRLIPINNKGMLEIESIEQRYEGPERVGHIYRDLLTVGTEWQVHKTIELETTDSLSIDDKQNIINAVKQSFRMNEEADSANYKELFYLNNAGDDYYAVVFYPKVFILKGMYSNANENWNIRIKCPCTNILGYMDGIYSLVSDANVDRIDNLYSTSE